MRKCLCACFLLMITWCQVHAQTSGYVNAGTGVQYELIGKYDLKKLNQILTTELEEFLSTSKMPYANFKGKFPAPKYAVRLYRVKYNSVVPEFGNTPTVASGLVAIPETGLDSMPMVSYQHGTVFGNTQCPSYPDESSETKLMIAQFAAQGYIVIGADYFGLGISKLPNSYLIRGSTEQACVDMLLAAKDVLAAQKIKPGALFVHGWSQGGWTTMTFLRKLESLNIQVTAASTASAPSDAFGSMNRWFNNYQSIDAVYLPGVVSNYLFAAESYNNDLAGLTASAIRPEYLQAARDLYDWKIDWTTFRSKTRDKLTDFLKPEFLATGNIGNTVFWLNLEKSQAYRWRCKTPLINFYGDQDEVVPVFIARLPAEYHKLLGCTTTTAQSAGSLADHRATYIYSILNAKPWYDGFLKKK